MFILALGFSDARSIIEPLLIDYVRTFNDGNFDRMHGYYHKNAVMVEKDKSVLWGQKDIVASLLQMATDCGKTRMEISNSKYDGIGDFLNVTTEFAFHTEKIKDYYLVAPSDLDFCAFTKLVVATIIYHHNHQKAFEKLIIRVEYFTDPLYKSGGEMGAVTAYIMMNTKCFDAD